METTSINYQAKDVNSFTILVSEIADKAAAVMTINPASLLVTVTVPDDDKTEQKYINDFIAKNSLEFNVCKCSSMTYESIDAMIADRDIDRETLRKALTEVKQDSDIQGKALHTHIEASKETITWLEKDRDRYRKQFTEQSFKNDRILSQIKAIGLLMESIGQ